jgi:hypothetical protein
MYKLEIKIDDWAFENEVVTIESHDFDKLAIFAEFIEFQKDHGWAVEYDSVDYEEDEEDEVDTEEDEDSEESEIGELVEDEDGALWERVA